MPVGNPIRDSENISENLSNFCKLRDCELILVIDSPTLSTHPKFEEFNNLQCKVKIIRKYVGNPGGARNEGLKNASGKWIVFVDSDDKTIFTLFHKMIIEANEKEAQLAVGEFLTQSNHSSFESHHRVENEFQTKESIARHPGIWRIGFLRETIEGVTFPEIRMAEDQVFLALLGFWKLKIYKSSDVVYIYRKNISGQLTKNKSAVKEILQALSRMLDILVKSKFNSVDSRFIGIMLSNQLITAMTRLNVRGFIFGIRLFSRLMFSLKSPRLAYLLLQTFLVESRRKIVKLIMTEGK